MDKTLTTARPGNGRIAAQDETDTLIATLPKWLAYLVGAFPGAQVNKMTFLAYETAFTEVDPALMLTAVQAVAKQHRFATFPTIAEINAAVEAESERLFLVERQALNLYHAIATARQELLDAAYAGSVDRAAWQAFAADCQTQGYGVNADWARRKLAQFEAASNDA